MTVEVVRALHVELVYHVLSHLDLGRDAASLHDPARPARPWVEPLRAAYEAAPARLAVQVLPLRASDLEHLRRVLASAAPGSLAACLLDAVEEQLGAVEARWAADRPAAVRRLGSLRPWLGARLAPLREALWARTDQPAPPLRLLDCPSLAAGDWSLGRATWDGGGRVCAVSLAPPREHVLCQVLHEEVHPVTDPGEAAAGQDTRPGTAGHAGHRARELRAVEVGQELVDARAPELAAAYAAWRARYGV